MMETIPNEYCTKYRVDINIDGEWYVRDHFDYFNDASYMMWVLEQSGKKARVVGIDIVKHFYVMEG